ncbi:rhodanese-like domain-containing protein [Fulvivirga ulvae]|uniref:rhodanese-like domain-containing protein n=1 Tax=Fulvivirga ulvae TaxID=2904245 RepID=UPI001F35353A|nr:rhodanese-like domain-containing protein [Fulvivirga ulvae]UII31120.1 rhodanese-like domain-containing protein [Fulvivirga ulvae]
MIQKVFFPALLVMMIASCGQHNEESEESSEKMPQSVTLVNIVEFHDLLKQEDLQLVDVRTPKEYDLDRIPGAVNIDYWSDEFTSQASELNKDQPVAVYCAAGRRSAKAASKLKEMGFRQIYDLDGGMRAWHTGPAPTD